jgi:hypothetical protein
MPDSQLPPYRMGSERALQSIAAFDDLLLQSIRETEDRGMSL